MIDKALEKLFTSQLFVCLMTLHLFVNELNCLLAYGISFLEFLLLLLDVNQLIRDPVKFLADFAFSLADGLHHSLLTAIIVVIG